MFEFKAELLALFNEGDSALLCNPHYDNFAVNGKVE